MSPRQERNGRLYGEVGRAIQDLLIKRGITDFRFGKSKHAYVIFTYGGAERRFTFPCTPHGAQFSAKMHLKALRQVLGP